MARGFQMVALAALLVAGCDRRSEQPKTTEDRTRDSSSESAPSESASPEGEETRIVNPNKPGGPLSEPLSDVPSDPSRARAQ
jgi:hypothetical protein